MQQGMMSRIYVALKAFKRPRLEEDALLLGLEHRPLLAQLQAHGLVLGDAVHAKGAAAHLTLAPIAFTPSMESRKQRKSVSYG